MIVAMRLRSFQSARTGPTLDRSFQGRYQALALILAFGLALMGCGPAPKSSDIPRAPVGLQERFYAPRGWTWSGLKVGDEVRRYGVASPPVVPRGSVLILSGEEPAEVWFETANDLIAKGYAVWLLEARPAAAATDTPGRMVREVIRPRLGQPLVVVADGLGANAALDSLALGSLPANAVILQRPVTRIFEGPRWLAPEQAETAAHWAVALRLGGLKAPQKETASASDPSYEAHRATLAAVWRRSDPDLRPPALTWSWLNRYDLTARRAAGKLANPQHLPIVMADDSGALANLCARLSGCEDWHDVGHAGQMQTDEVRSRWMVEIMSLLERYRTAKP